MNDAQIRHMVNGFLSWRLPRNFRPDAGISFDPPVTWPWPTGTNLFDAVQATAMVQHMVASLPANEIPQEQAVQLAELVLSMGLITEKGLYARHIARTILESREHAPPSEDTEVAALRAENAECKTLATEIEAKLFALSGAVAALTERGARICDFVGLPTLAAEIREKKEK